MEGLNIGVWVGLLAGRKVLGLGQGLGSTMGPELGSKMELGLGLELGLESRMGRGLAHGRSVGEPGVSHRHGQEASHPGK